MTLRDLLISKGFRPEWFSPLDGAARLDLRLLEPCFKPFLFRHRFLRRWRLVLVKDVLGVSGTQVKFSGRLQNEHGFLLMLEYNSTSAAREDFSWNEYLEIGFLKRPRQLADRLDYFWVEDKKKNKRWEVYIGALSWVGDIEVKLPEENL